MMRYQWVWVICLIVFLSLGLREEKAETLELNNDRASSIVGAQAVRALQFVPGSLDGTGQIIGIADSGLDRGTIQSLHEDLRSEPGRLARVVLLRSYSGRSVPDDPVGHGTHMAATLVGSGAASQGQYQGIAPGASVYFQALLSPNGQLVVPAAEALFSPAYEAGVRLHVNGWGRETNRYSQFTAEIDSFVYRHTDFLPIFGAGNLGPSVGSLSTESNSKNALVVGSSEVPRPTFSAEASSALQVAASSSRGPTADGRIKPDVLAPGSAVISAASALIRSNFTANPQYTRMGGSSMAAAVAGGSSALLAQYLEAREETNRLPPSAALFKALLINGADLDSDERYAYGFGILNIAQTILSLQTGLTRYEDQSRLLQQDQTLTYTFAVEYPEFPVKVTLAWTDPAGIPSASAALINDLDLTVTAPDGTVYYGNDIEQLGVLDRRNNVEQVWIAAPQAGTYQVQVAAARIAEAYWRQDFSLVYGQVLRQQTIAAVSGRQITLSDGAVLDLNRYRTQFFLRGDSGSLMSLQPGYQVYYSPEQAFIFGDFWAGNGVQMLEDQQGTIVAEMSPKAREGGYYIDSSWLAKSQNQLLYNEVSVPLADIPRGVGVDAVVNPFLQTLWGLKVRGVLVDGYIESINVTQQQLRLLRDETIYQLMDSTAVTYVHNRSDANAESEPFGYFEQPSWQTLLPGIQVTMMINPVSREILHISAQRETVLGRVTEVNAQEQTVYLDNGKAYVLFTGAQLFQQDALISLEDLQPGDWLGGILLPGTDNLLTGQVIESISWGCIIYFSERLSQLYVLDQHNAFQLLSLDPQAMIMQEGVVLDRRSLRAGQWVRIFSGPDPKLVYRVDIAEIAEEGEATVRQYTASEQRLYLTDGRFLSLAPSTLCVRQGMVVLAEDLLPGDVIQFTSLRIPGGNRTYTARAEIRGSTSRMPALTAQAHYLNGALIITGSTRAEYLYVYRENFPRERLVISTDGNFSQVFLGDRRETALTVMAVSPGQTAHILTAPIIPYPVAPAEDRFTDAILSPYDREIEFLHSRGVISGYEDGLFHPQATISRMEFIVMLVRASGQDIASMEEIYYFKDFGQIPWWGLTAANAAKRNGWADSFPDQVFRPNDLLRAEEMQEIMNDIEDFDFALPAVQSDYVSREEAARVVYLLMVAQQ